MSKLDEMYTALAPAKKDGYPVTQIAYDELQSALVTANERIREWSDNAMEFSTIASRYEEELAAEREVSDKLEKALKDTLSHLVAAASLLSRSPKTAAPTISEGLVLVRDGNSLAMLQSPDGRIFRIQQLGTGDPWGNAADNDELVAMLSAVPKGDKP